MQATGPLHSQEQRRLLILNQRARDAVAVAAAAAGMGGSVRPVHRLRAAYRDAGAAALVPGHRGRTPAHTRAPALRQRVRALAQAPPSAGNPPPMRALFAERAGIRLAHASLRRILFAASVASPRPRRAPTHRRRRDRSPQAGMLLSRARRRHAWRQRWRPCLARGGGIDAAPPSVPSARLRDAEDAHGYG